MIYLKYYDDRTIFILFCCANNISFGASLTSHIIILCIHIMFCYNDIAIIIIPFIRELICTNIYIRLFDFENAISPARYQHGALSQGFIACTQRLKSYHGIFCFWVIRIQTESCYLLSASASCVNHVRFIHRYARNLSILTVAIYTQNSNLHSVDCFFSSGNDTPVYFHTRVRVNRSISSKRSPRPNRGIIFSVSHEIL